MNYNTIHKGFTLIELMVAITIFAIIMVTVMSIFIFSSQMSTRIELGRVMQENIKNVSEDIAEEVRKGRIIDSSATVSPLDVCVTPISGGHSITAPETGNKLCLEGDIEYTIGNKVSGNWDRISNPADCSDETEDDDSVCRVLKRVGGGDYFPLTNNRVAVEKLEFVLTNEELPKVTLFLSMRPTYKKGLSSQIVDLNALHVQTTISERFIETY